MIADGVDFSLNFDSFCHAIDAADADKGAAASGSTYRDSTLLGLVGLGHGDGLLNGGWWRYGCVCSCWFDGVDGGDFFRGFRGWYGCYGWWCVAAYHADEWGDEFALRLSIKDEEFINFSNDFFPHLQLLDHFCYLGALSHEGDIELNLKQVAHFPLLAAVGAHAFVGEWLHHLKDGDASGGHWGVGVGWCQHVGERGAVFLILKATEGGPNGFAGKKLG